MYNRLSGFLDAPQRRGHRCDACFCFGLAPPMQFLGLFSLMFLTCIFSSVLQLVVEDWRRVFYVFASLCLPVCACVRVFILSLRVT